VVGVEAPAQPWISRPRATSTDAEILWTGNHQGEIVSGFVAVPNAHDTARRVRFGNSESEFTTGRRCSLRRTPVPLDLNASLAVFERHLQNLIGQVPVGVEFIQHLGE
jgi:hypothetical protein